MSLTLAILFAVASSALAADSVEIDHKTADALIERAWSETQKKLDDVQANLDKMMQEAAGGPDDLANLPDEFKGMLDASPMKEKLKILQDLSAKIPYTDDDCSAIEAYAFGEYDRAEGILEGTIAQEPRRVMPLFTFACLRFEQRRFEDAVRLLDQVLELHPESPTAHVLKKMSTRLAGNASPTPLELLEAYDYAYAECVAPAPEEDFGLNIAMMLASAMTSPLTYDPVLMRFKELMVPARLKFIMRLLQEYKAESDVDKKVALAFVIGAPLGSSLIEELSAKYPDDAQLKVLNLLCELTRLWKKDMSVSFPEEIVGELRAIEPENGAFMLMAIKEIKNEEPPFDSPLNEAELRLYEEGVTAGDFDGHFRDATEEMIRLYPEVNDKMYHPDYLVGRLALSKATHATWRARTSIAQRFAEGREKEALPIIQLTRQLAGRIRSRGDGISVLRAMSIQERCADSLIERAIEAGATDWPSAAIDEKVAVLRETVLCQLSIHNLNGFNELPVRTMMGGGDYGTDFVKWTHDRAERMMALYGEEFAEEAYSELSEYYEIYAGAEYVRDNLFTQGTTLSNRMLKLEMLGRRDALPLLSKIAQEDWPLAARVAQEAIRRINEMNPAPVDAP
jgi:hypothetical protein